MQLTRKAEYAIGAMVDLAYHQDEPYVLSRDVALREGIPLKLVAQIVSALGKAGWVKGTRGSQGGIRLIVDPAKVTVKEIIELIEGPIAINKCLEKDSKCERRASCAIKGMWAKAQKELVGVLEGTTIADLVEVKKRIDRQEPGTDRG